MSKDLFGHDKIEETIERLKIFEPPEGYYLAFSGGKDSCVIKDLAIRSGVKFFPYMQLTTVDPPEVIIFTKKNHPDVKFIRPKYTMKQHRTEDSTKSNNITVNWDAEWERAESLLGCVPPPKGFMTKEQLQEKWGVK